MNNTKTIKEIFARLFVLAIQYKANLFSFTYQLERSAFVDKIEEGKYDDYFNKSLIDIFFDVTGNKISEDNSYGIYDDAYWCGYSYYEIHLRTRKPFSYIFLKLPLAKMIDIYSIYHEMDISSLLEYFSKQEKDKTILRLLCEQNRTSLPRLSFKTGISLTTLSKYNADDNALYKASFQNIIKISRYFGSPINLFIIRINGSELDEKHIEIFGDNYSGYYLSTRTACRGIVIDGDRILLSYETKTDQYMIPGGGLDNNENDKECVVREIREETGYIVEVIDFFLEIEEYYETDKYISKYYLCQIKDKSEPSLTEREKEVGMELRWVRIQEAIDVFSKYKDYTSIDEMRRGLYLREYSALKRVFDKK